MLTQTTKSLKKINRAFIIFGLFEIFAFVYITASFFSIIIGLITIIPAYLAQEQQRFKLNYFVAAWGILKFNPISLGLFAFLVADFFMLTERTGSTIDFSIIIILGVFFLLISLASLVLAIILIIKTIKYYKLQKQTT
jgi:hypothetical protein